VAESFREVQLWDVRFHGLILLATVRLVSPLNVSHAYIAKPIAVLWVTAATFFVAWLSYHTYEKQFLRLKALFRTPASENRFCITQFKTQSENPRHFAWLLRLYGRVL